MKPHKDILRPHGRSAHIELQNREGQAWKPGRVEVEGVDIFGNKKKFMAEKGHFRCKKCDAVVRFDIRGYAHCEKCGDIYNDGVAEAQKIKARSKRNADRSFRAKCSRKD